MVAWPGNSVRQSNRGYRLGSATGWPGGGLPRSRYRRRAGCRACGCGNDAFAEWPASRIIGGKRPVDVVVDRQVLPPGPAPLLPPWRRRSRHADAVSNPRPPMPRVRAPSSASRNRRPGEERLVNMFQTIQELRRQQAVRFVAHLSDSSLGKSGGTLHAGRRISPGFLPWLVADASRTQSDKPSNLTGAHLPPRQRHCEDVRACPQALLT